MLWEARRGKRLCYYDLCWKRGVVCCFGFLGTGVSIARRLGKHSGVLLAICCFAQPRTQGWEIIGSGESRSLPNGMTSQSSFLRRHL